MISFRRNTPHWLGMAGVGLAAAGLLATLFSAVLRNPDDYFFSAGGDGLQSYFVTTYYALYDSGSHFSGMNYPFGENFNYPNLQPLIAWLISVLQRLGIPAAQHTVGITNMVALLGVLLTPLVLYAILRRTRMGVGYAVVLALIIGFLSPQVQRLGDHMSLSYACFVPLLWYFIIRMQDEPRRNRWYVLFAVSSLLMGMVQPYFLACGTFFLLCHVLVLALRPTRSWPQLGRMAAAALLPLLLFRVLLWATDPITDRPPNPYGFLTYMATPRGVFTPYLEPLRSLWIAVFPTEDIAFESMSYVGLVSTGILAISGLLLLGRLWKRRRQPRRMLGRSLPQHLLTGLLASALLLVFSFAVPFIFPGFENLVQYLGPLKQFRALGRFAWPFYYALSVYSAYYLYRLLRYQRQHRVPLLALPWLPLLLAFWAAEAWINISTKAKTVEQGVGAQAYLDPATSPVQQLSWANRRPSDFQAIMPLPYINKGTDRIDLNGSAASAYQGYKLSLAMGLPVLSTYIPRSSIEQMLRHVQLLSSPLIDKPLLRQFPSAKPLLLVVTPDVLTPEEQRLVSIAKPLLQAEGVALYELPIAALAATTLAQERTKAATLLPTLPKRANNLYVTTDRGIVHLPFDQNPERRGRLAPGAFYEKAEKQSMLYDGPIPTPADTGRYEASVWINGKMDYGYGYMLVKQFSNGTQVDEQVADGRLATEIAGDWVRMRVLFRPAPNVDRIQVLYGGRDVLADDFLLRPLNTDVYWLDAQKQPILNGYQLGK
ncbi:hypothetical protein E5K00_21635 [Hymenobacter aquaticus]|uniref:DUF6311 domain-containing protein n=1 Tax=Hymenobacter aquaticus TaxID=1867101 RepID=A0A4Z0PTG1_9BACT|nr:hypothetical protein [Hymenobacter aquaticus]TGE20599.1 hypothetical protein E5K00_21635 [Hymenobacter aquaticus]